ncbi:MAG: DNA methyltransferase [Conexivisphaera sp.]
MIHDMKPELGIPHAAVREAFRTERGIYYVGDALEILPALEEGSVDVVFTDPPFFLEDDGQYGSYKSYVAALPYLARVMKQDAWLLVYFPSNRLDAALRDTGQYFTYVDRFVVLYQSNTSKGAFSGKRTLELLVFQKGKPKTSGRTPMDVLDGVEDPLIVHTHPRGSVWKPTLPTAILLSHVFAPGSDGVVLDPFAGYGSIPACAEALGLRWVAMDNDPEKVEIAKGIVGAVHAVRSNY